MSLRKNIPGRGNSKGLGGRNEFAVFVLYRLEEMKGDKVRVGSSQGRMRVLYLRIWKGAQHNKYSGVEKAPNCVTASIASESCQAFPCASSDHYVRSCN
jgi:hypothetical protein